jgi:hypothetical protein
VTIAARIERHAATGKLRRFVAMDREHADERQE